MASFHIRSAEEKDIPVIIQLIKDLAEYEKALSEAKATPELLKINLFDKKHASAIIAIDGPAGGNGRAVGLALYFFNFSTWTGRPGLYLEDLYVDASQRNKGIGKALFAELAVVAQANNCARMDWAVLNWNTPSISFYKQVLGATAMDDWTGMRLEEGGIESLKRFRLQQ